MGGARQSQTFKEMWEGVSLIPFFKPETADPLVKAHLRWNGIVSNPGIHLVGEGSSMKAPCANLLYLAKRDERLSQTPIYSYGGSEAEDVFHTNATVILLSNSGVTAEPIILAEKLKKLGHPAVCAITANGSSPLAQVCGPENTVVLGIGEEERVVPATKSVMQQMLVLQAFLFPDHFSDLKFNFEKASWVPRQILANSIINPDKIEIIVGADNIYVAGPLNGVADESALKIIEILKNRTVYYPNTSSVHGPQEMIGLADAALLIDLPEKPTRALNDVLGEKCGAKLLAINEEQTAVPTIVIPKVHPVFKAYTHLSAVWTLSVDVADKLGTRIDQPRVATKVATNLETYTR